MLRVTHDAWVVYIKYLEASQTLLKQKCSKFRLKRLKGKKSIITSGTPLSKAWLPRSFSDGNVHKNWIYGRHTSQGLGIVSPMEYRLEIDEK